MKKRGISITVIFKGQSLNYGEGIGNVAELKKMSRGDGSVLTYASRQALRYDISRLGQQLYNWNLEVVDDSQGTIQFKSEIGIKDSEEMDLFGYMKTKKSKNEDEEGGSETRTAPVRLSNAISLEEYKSDMDFLNNKGLADRIGKYPNLANIEQHLSYYTYTITIDLERIGIDGNTVLSNDDKAKRVNQLLEILKVLNRNIRGREENLSPVFVVGGIYTLNSPFFQGRIKLDTKDGKYNIVTNILRDTIELKIGEERILDNTKIGMIKSVFNNEKEIEELFEQKSMTVQEFFEDIEKQVIEYYK